MKIKLILTYGWALCLFLVSACSDDDKDVNPGESLLPPGPEYVREGNYCVNVVCYFAKGLDTLENWHKVYSGYMLGLQSQFREQMTLCGYPDKTFNLEVNKQNPAYVNIIRYEGQKDTLRTTSEVITEVAGYLELHPELKKSDFTVIFTPRLGVATSHYFLNEKGKITGSGLISSYSNADVSVDGNLMQTFGRMCFLPFNTEPMSEIYYSLMNQAHGAAYWGMGSRLLKADAMWLSLNQVFNDKTLSYFSEFPEVKVTRADFKYVNNQIEVTCEFTSQQNIAAVVAYNDPWDEEDRKNDILDNNYTTGDAIPYATDEVNKNGNQYKITLHIPWNDMQAGYKVPHSGGLYREAEIRFRFLGENGMAVPVNNKGDIKSGYRYPYTILSLVPDFERPVDTDIPVDEEETEETE